MVLNDGISFDRKCHLCYNCLSNLHLQSHCNSQNVCVRKRKSPRITSLICNDWYSFGSPCVNSQEIDKMSERECAGCPAKKQVIPNSRVSFFAYRNNKSAFINMVVIHLSEFLGKKRPFRGILYFTSESNITTIRASNALNLKWEKIIIPITQLPN